MSIREGYEMCYFGSTEHMRVDCQECSSYIAKRYNKDY